MRLSHYGDRRIFLIFYGKNGQKKSYKTINNKKCSKNERKLLTLNEFDCILVLSRTEEVIQVIYTVTFNPSLDYIVSVKDFKTGITNRTDSEKILPGGKGINVSTVLMNLGIPNTALGFVAGFTGDEIIRRLSGLGVNNGFIRLDDGFSRINLKLSTIEGLSLIHI